MKLNSFFVYRWASLPNPDEYIQPSLSPTGSAMLQAIAVGLQWLKDSLASTLFSEAWQNLASQINMVKSRLFPSTYRRMCHSSILSVGSFSLKSSSYSASLTMEALLSFASTFSRTWSLFSVNWQAGLKATLESKRCHSFAWNKIPVFNDLLWRLKDACTLLRLPRPITLLLLDTLALAVQDDGSASVKAGRALADGKMALKDQGVRKLSVEDALSVLRRRILWPCISFHCWMSLRWEIHLYFVAARTLPQFHRSDLRLLKGHQPLKV